MKRYCKTLIAAILVFSMIFVMAGCDYNPVATENDSVHNELFQNAENIDYLIDHPEQDSVPESVVSISEGSTEDEIMKFYSNASSLIAELELGFTDVDYSDSIQTENMSSYRILDDRFATYKSFVENFSSYFTEDYIISAANNTHIMFTEDGSGYCDGGARGSSISAGKNLFGKISFSENQATLTILTEKLDIESDGEVIGYDEYIYQLKYENENWKFNNFEFTH